MDKLKIGDKVIALTNYDNAHDLKGKQGVVTWVCDYPGDELVHYDVVFQGWHHGHGVINYSTYDEGWSYRGSKYLEKINTNILCLDEIL